MPKNKVEDVTPDPLELIDCNEAAKLLTLAANTIRDGNGGTSSLTRIRIPGGGAAKKPSIRLLKVEVLALRAKWIEAAKFQAAAKERALRKYDGAPI